jgi:hypothetical protein
VVGVYREHAGGIYSSLKHAQIVVSDIQTQFRVIPLFAGADRIWLEDLLRSNVIELLEANDISALTKLKCASMAAIRSPGDARAWKNLAAGVRTCGVLPRK